MLVCDYPPHCTKGLRRIRRSGGTRRRRGWLFGRRSLTSAPAMSIWPAISLVCTTCHCTCRAPPPPAPQVEEVSRTSPTLIFNGGVHLKTRNKRRLQMCKIAQPKTTFHDRLNIFPLIIQRIQTRCVPWIRGLLGVSVPSRCSSVDQSLILRVTCPWLSPGPLCPFRPPFLFRSPAFVPVVSALGRAWAVPRLRVWFDLQGPPSGCNTAGESFTLGRRGPRSPPPPKFTEGGLWKGAPRATRLLPQCKCLKILAPTCLWVWGGGETCIRTADNQRGRTPHPLWSDTGTVTGTGTDCDSASGFVMEYA